MKYIEEDTKDEKKNGYVIVIIILSVLLFLACSYIVIDLVTADKVNCEEPSIEVKDDEDTTQDKEEDKEEKEDKITVDTSYKINPNLPNMSIVFAGSSCTLLEDHFIKNKVDEMKSYIIDIKDIELNSQNHKYKYVVDIEQNSTIEVFDSEYIATKDSASYMLVKVCNYDNHFITVEADKNSDAMRRYLVLKIINIYGEIVYYEDNLLSVDYNNELLYLSYVQDNVYKRVTLDLKKELEENVVIEENVDCSKFSATDSSLSVEEKEMFIFCELTKESLS